MSGKPLTSVGSLSAHTRPISCIDGMSLSDTSAVLYTADSMGAIKTWDLVKEGGETLRWKGTLKSEMNYHRTGVNEMRFGRGQLWTGKSTCLIYVWLLMLLPASSDDTAQILVDPTSTTKPPVSITHPTAVRCILPLAATDLAEPYLLTGAGDVIRVYDVSSIHEPELINEIDAHWYDVTALHLWLRKTVGTDAKARVEPWVVSTSLDGTIRKWRLAGMFTGSVFRTRILSASELLTPAPPSRPEPKIAKPATAKAGSKFEMTEEEERELADLLDD